jgi:hypothetical protein
MSSDRHGKVEQNETNANMRETGSLQVVKGHDDHPGVCDSADFPQQKVANGPAD